MSELDKKAVALHSGSPEKASHLWLRNIGAYVCELEIYVFRDGEQTRIPGTGKDICVGQSEELDVGQYGVEEGEMFTAYCNVKLGKDVYGKKWVTYDPNVNRRANYEATGTTLSDSCNFLGTTARE